MSIFKRALPACAAALALAAAGAPALAKPFGPGGPGHYKAGAPGHHKAAVAPKGWAKLGSRAVSDRAERDVIALPGKGRFGQIRLCVSSRAVALYDLDVFFANGGHQDVKVRRNFKAGQCTRAIDLKGDRRNISRIVMKYETIRDRGRQGVVTVYGR